MIVSRIQPANDRRSGQNVDASDRLATATPASVALVPVAASAEAPRSAKSSYRPDPAFVAHLIAVAQQSPQTRKLRRASADEVLGHYRAADPLTPAASGLVLSRVA